MNNNSKRTISKHLELSDRKTSQTSERAVTTILTEIMADELNFLRPEIGNYKAEGRCRFNSYPRPIRITWQMQMWCLAVYMLLCSLFLADLIVGMEELELHYRCRGKSNLRKIRIATISVRMVRT